MRTFSETLDYVEGLTIQTYEEDVASAFKQLVPEGDQASWQLLYELLAFSFGEHNEKDELGWETYFGPGIIWQNEGVVTVSPDINQVKADVIEYWKKRASETSNPLLKARYSGLIWDMEKKIMGNRPVFNYAISYIESLLALAEEGRYKHPVSLIDKLKRALDIATGINNTPLVNTAKQTILDLEDRIAEDDKPGLWGFAFDYLVGNKKAGLSLDEEANIITSLEERLNRLSTGAAVNPHAAEGAATRLADFYQSHAQPEEVKRVMLQLGKAFEDDTEDGSILNKTGRLEQLHKLYTYYKLHDDAKAVLIKLRSISAGVGSEMQTFSHKITLTREEVDGFTDAMLSGEIKDVMLKIASHFTPDKDSTEKVVLDLARKHPLQYLFSTTIVDAQGRHLAQIGNIHNDLDGQVVKQISQSMEFSAMFVNLTIRRFFDKFNINSDIFIDEYMRNSPAFEEAKWQIIKRALDAYFEEDYMLFMHFVIPQIEDAFRSLVERMGGLVLKPAKNGGFHLKTFDEILRDDTIITIYGEDCALYLRILFTDQRGWNLRNNLCHGLLSEPSMDVVPADRLFHILILLSLLERAANNESATQ